MAATDHAPNCPARHVQGYPCTWCRQHGSYHCACVVRATDVCDKLSNCNLANRELQTRQVKISLVFGAIAASGVVGLHIRELLYGDPGMQCAVLGSASLVASLVAWLSLVALGRWRS